MTLHSQDTRSLLIFFALAYFCSWSVWVLIAADFVHPLLTGVGASAPSLVAIFLTYRGGGKLLLRRLVRRALPRRVDTPVYVAAVCIPFVTVGIGLGAYSFVAATPIALEVPFPWFLVPLHLVAGLIFLGPVQEEFGWRGFALPRLLTSLRPVPGSLVLGLLWSLWHLPLFWIDGSFQSHQPFWLFLLSTVALSLPYTLLYLMTGRRLAAPLVFHVSTNTAATVALYEPTVRGNLGPLVATTVITTLVGMGAAMLLSSRHEVQGPGPCEDPSETHPV
ncbi:MAG: CPBP family intramembrane metalloprotease [Actinobacteria bacterium]|nr:CPBP family intramembrane metalloprotease [Actinomycetota bacterium]